MSTAIRQQKHTRIQPSVTRETNRRASAFQSKRLERRYWILLILFFSGGVLSTIGLLLYNNPVPFDSPSFWPVVERRITAVITMAIAAICQSLATVTSAFLTQVAIMLAMSLLLYGWLLSGKYANLQLMLLVGIILGTGLNSLSSFMRKMLAPSEFDILQARLFGSVTNADASYFPIVIPIVLIVGLLLYFSSGRLNVVALGKEVATSFGVNHRGSVIYFLILISLLMSMSTALIGPLTFFGFLVATLSYQVAATYDHRYVFPMAFAIGFFVLTTAYFFMYHIFNTPSVVSVIIELFGGLIFLVVLLRKRSL